MPGTHQQIDDRSLAMHRLIAKKLRGDPKLLSKAKATLTRWRRRGDESTRSYDDEWARALDEGLDATLRIALGRSQRAVALRQCSPFAGILTPQERAAFLRAWKQRRASSGS
ncbi:MAG: hypothetical protein WCC48_03240 [Anaeromyxobacteraceae bacterium]